MGSVVVHQTDDGPSLEGKADYLVWHPEERLYWHENQTMEINRGIAS